MFNKVKNELTLINMVITISTVIMAFTFVFFLMATLLERDSMSVMRTISSNELVTFKTNQRISSDYLIVYTDLDNKTILIENNLEEIDSSVIKVMVTKALTSGKAEGTFRESKESYRYLITLMPRNQNKVVFYNMKLERDFLSRLALTLILLGGIIAAMSFFLSKFLAGKALIPIQESWEKQKAFTQDASHELRTPLTVMKTNLEVLASNPDETIESQSKWIKYIDEEITRMSKLVHDLLMLARIDSDKQIEEKRFTNISNIFNELVDSYSNLADVQKITLSHNIESNISIVCDKDKIKQLANILLDNALKYNSKEGSIDVVLKKANNNVELIVKDTGIGIPKEELEKIFDRFYVADKSRKKGGNGLGLSIAKHIVSEHKGTIKVTSEPSKGSEFKVTFPI